MRKKNFLSLSFVCFIYLILYLLCCLLCPVSILKVFLLSLKCRTSTMPLVLATEQRVLPEEACTKGEESCCRTAQRSDLFLVATVVSSLLTFFFFPHSSCENTRSWFTLCSGYRRVLIITSDSFHFTLIS